MMANCPALTTGQAFLQSALSHIDCQAQTLGSAGYQALADPASPASLALTALLTLFIAVQGIRLLMGQLPNGGQLIGIALKLGIVLMLASSWGAWRIIAYDMVLHSPAEVAGILGDAAEVPTARTGLIPRLQAIDDKIVAFSALGAGRLDLTTYVPDPATNPMPTGRTVVNDDLAFGAARLSFLVSVMGLLSFLWLAGGLFLALAPLFAGLLLFEATRGFFFGWIRAMVAVTLGTLAVYIMLAIESSLLEPWLSSIISLRQARIPTPSAPIELLAMALAFAVLLAGVVTLCGRIAFAFHIPAAIYGSLRAWAPPSLAAPKSMTPAFREISPPSRAAMISEAVTTIQRRETLMTNRMPAVQGMQTHMAVSNSGFQGASHRQPLSATNSHSGAKRRISHSMLERRKQP